MIGRGPIPSTAETEPTDAGFSGWRMVWIAALVLTIGSYEAGLPQFLRLGLTEVRTILSFDPVLTAAYWFSGALPIILLPLVGWAVDRWGARHMVLCGLAALGSGALLLPATRYMPVVFLSLSAASIGSVVTAQLPCLAVVNNWFRRRRATAMSAMMLPATAVYTLARLFPGYLRLTVVHAPVVVVVAAVLVLAIAWPVSRMLRNRPEDWGEQPDGGSVDARSQHNSSPSDALSPSDPDYTWQEALRTRSFWLMIACAAAFQPSASPRHLYIDAPHARAGKFPHSIWQWTRWLDGALLVTSVPLGGLLGDRFPIRRVMFAFGLVESLSMAVLAFATTLPMFLLAAALSGIGVGGGLPLTYAALGLYFGRRNFATIAGLSLFLLQTVGVGAATLAVIGHFAIARPDRLPHPTFGHHWVSECSRFLGFPVPGRSEAVPIAGVAARPASTPPPRLMGYQCPY